MTLIVYADLSIDCLSLSCIHIHYIYLHKDVKNIFEND